MRGQVQLHHDADATRRRVLHKLSEPLLVVFHGHAPRIAVGVALAGTGQGIIKAQRKRCIVGRMPVQHVQVRGGHGVDRALEDGWAEEVPRGVHEK